VLLAAGAASRFGTPKQALSIDGISMVRRAAITAIKAGLAPVVVVIGAHAELVTRSLDGLDIHLADNPHWSAGMGSSLAAGVRQVLEWVPSLQAIMVLLADQPAISTVDLAHMLQRRGLRPERILAAQYDGHLGPPCIFPDRYFNELARLDGPTGARSLLERYAGHVDTYDLPSGAFDIDTPDDHASWMASRRAAEPDRES